MSFWVFLWPYLTDDRGYIAEKSHDRFQSYFGDRLQPYIQVYNYKAFPDWLHLRPYNFDHRRAHSQYYSSAQSRSSTSSRATHCCSSMSMRKVDWQKPCLLREKSLNRKLSPKVHTYAQKFSVISWASKRRWEHGRLTSSSAAVATILPLPHK